MKNTISSQLNSSAGLKGALASDSVFTGLIQTAAQKLLEVKNSGGTIYACGNGGSACDAMHLCEELVARYKRERPGIRAMHFSDPSTVTCWANDYSYETVFSRQVETFCTSKDALICFSTSGNSKNIIKALEAARLKQCTTIALLGKDGGSARQLADISLVVPAQETARIQEVHITLVHILCELIETC